MLIKQKFSNEIHSKLIRELSVVLPGELYHEIFTKLYAEIINEFKLTFNNTIELKIKNGNKQRI